MNCEAPVIDDDGTWKWKYQYKNEKKTNGSLQNTWKRSGDAGYETIIELNAKVPFHFFLRLIFCSWKMHSW